MAPGGAELIAALVEVPHLVGFADEARERVHPLHACMQVSDGREGACSRQMEQACNTTKLALFSFSALSALKTKVRFLLVVMAKV